jgi:hypothetical protein
MHTQHGLGAVAQDLGQHRSSQQAGHSVTGPPVPGTTLVARPLQQHLSYNCTALGQQQSVTGPGD